jgi:hypothetical protein
VTDVASLRQTFRKIALVFAYALVAGFGAATMLIMENRPLDTRGTAVICIIAAGAFCGAAFIMLFAKRLMQLSFLPRFIAVFFDVMLATLLMQGLLAGGVFNLTALTENGPLISLDGMMDLSFIAAYGFAYYLVYGLALIWPVAIGASLLFSLGFLTLQSQRDTNETTRRLN